MPGSFADYLALEFGAPDAAKLLGAHADRAALRRLLAPLPTRSRIVRSLLLSHPGNRVGSETAEPAVPRQIAQFCHDAEPPPEIAEIAASWRAGNPGFAYQLFSDQTARDFVQTHFPGDPLRAYDYCRHKVLRADLFRYLYLLREGGWFVDAEEACLHPIEPALAGTTAIGLTPRAWLFQDNREIPVNRAIESKLDATVCAFYLVNAPLAAVPGHRLLQAVANGAVAAILQSRSRGAPARVADATAPPVFTEVVLTSLLGPAQGLTQLADIGLLAEWTGKYAAPPKPSHKSGAASWHSEHVPPEPRRNPATISATADAGQAQPPPITPPPPQAAQNPLAVIQAMLDYRLFVERFIALNGVSSIVEVGCGDWPFVRLANLPTIQYIGFDIAEPVVQRNRVAFAPRRQVAFEMMPEDYADLPPADLVLLKDVLQHLPNAAILRVKTELLPRFPYALITNSWKRPNSALNTEIEAGRFRALDLTRDPYQFPGAYVLESWSEWDRSRTLLVCRDRA